MITSSPPAERWNNRALVRLLWPLIVEQLLAVAMGAADTIMVTTVGEHAVSGVSLVDNINHLLIVAFAALATGGTVVVSQYIGRLDMKNANTAARQLMYTAAALSLVLMLAAIFTRGPVLSLVYGELPGDVLESARIYYLLTALSFPFLAVYNSAAALYRAMANTRVPMLIALLVNVINIGGNAIFIYGFHLGAAGAGLSTLLCRAAAALVLTAMLMRGKKKIISLTGLFSVKLEPALIRSILAVGIPSGIEGSIFQFGRLLVTRIFTTFGKTAIAANAISFVVNSVCFMPGQAFSLALLTIVGQCSGARNYEGARSYTRKIVKISYAALITLSALNFIFMEPIVSLFSLSPEAHDLAKSFLTVHCVTLALLWTTSWAIPSALRAAGDATYCMVVSVISMWIVRVSGAYLLSYTFAMGPVGAWFAMGADFVVRSLFFVLRWRSGKWQTKKVIKD